MSKTDEINKCIRGAFNEQTVLGTVQLAPGNR